MIHAKVTKIIVWTTLKGQIDDLRISYINSYRIFLPFSERKHEKPTIIFVMEFLIYQKSVAAVSSM